MSNKLTAKEISERHGVSERTAYRWLADSDSRCYDNDTPSSGTRSTTGDTSQLRLILDGFSKRQFDLFLWVYKEAPEEKRGAWEKLRRDLWRVLNALRRESGLYPPEDTFSEAEIEESKADGSEPEVNPSASA